MSIEEKPEVEKVDEENFANIDRRILDLIQQLSYDKRQEVLDFVEFLKQKKDKPKKPFKSSEGILAHLNIDFDEKDLYEVRREMWANFPRDITL